MFQQEYELKIIVEILGWVLEHGHVLTRQTKSNDISSRENSVNQGRKRYKNEAHRGEWGDSVRRSMDESVCLAREQVSSCKEKTSQITRCYFKEC